MELQYDKSYGERAGGIMALTRWFLVSQYRKVATHPQMLGVARVVLRLMIAIGLVASCWAQNDLDNKSLPENRPEATAARLSGLHAAARIVRDTHHIAHIQASDEHDLFFLEGYVQAEDRLFQMDQNRHLASGTLAELIGSKALAQDVQLRVIGLRRAAERSLAVQSPRVLAILQAFADGVNTYASSHALPPEYAALKLRTVDPWTPLDSLVLIKLLSFNESFHTDIQPTVELLSYQAAGGALGFDGSKLFFEDLERAAPFDSASTVPDASGALAIKSDPQKRFLESTKFIGAHTLQIASEYETTINHLEFFASQQKGQELGLSNEWAISGDFTTSGAAMLANDPHLDLGIPSIWYPVHLKCRSLDAIGEQFPGLPLILLGHNRFVSWGLTDGFVDTADTFQEKIVPDASSPSGFSTVYKGKNEPVIPIPEVFRTNQGGVLVTVPAGNGIPPAVLVVPRRNNGPVLSFDPASGSAISVQWTGFSGSQELEGLLAWTEAHNLEDFRAGNSFVSSASLNLAYADVEGNIAYFALGEVPIREDLQAGVVNGLPPFFLRNGTGGNEWLPVINPQPHQASPFEILPAAEMPHLVNPPAGFFVNSNNDPAGVTLSNNPLGMMRPNGGIYYLGSSIGGVGFNAGFRAGRLTQMLRQRLATGGISFDDMQKMQADVTLFDAEFFVPFITQAFNNAKTSANPRLAALAASSGIGEAVSRLSAWNFTTPTGIPEGFDAGDPVPLAPRSTDEIANSVAATLYSVWRGQFVSNTIDAALSPAKLPLPPDSQALKALKHLLEDFSTTKGIGASGLNFFNMPDVSLAADRRDIVILQSLASSLSLLSSPAFAHAFGGSANQGDYRWGKLHRITFSHVLGDPFSIPSAGGRFPQPLLDLPGIPTDGGFETVDAANHPVRAFDENAFVFKKGPSKRSVYVASPEGIRSVSSLPGGVSGVLGSDFYFNLLPAWLRNEAYEQLFEQEQIERVLESEEKFIPSTQ
ncbi:MAG TPA: penicillin acylase family protein [Terriglobales bacterium]|nr:penicillin acylase family protein [Terriglobales bacterium]